MSEFIPLSVPNFGAREAELAGQAITSGWVSTSGGKVTELKKRWPLTWACPAPWPATPVPARCIWPLWPPASPAGMSHRPDADLHRRRQPADPLCRAEPIFIGCDDSLCIDPDAVEDFCANRCELRDGRLYNKATGAHIKALESCMCSATWPTCPA